jgi:diaminohydroxyphosphoribosylaminopyrimidine deaminase/5-amino-6-(5-phosphoribosylamino)uracil reductase
MDTLACTQTDRAYLARAIELAANGAGRTHPNPVVGAVIATEQQVLGEGWHGELGGPHAEIHAIDACGDADLSQATLYVTLEPCCHQGLTPPCTDAIIAAGIRRIVVASDDPSSKAAGRGLGILRDEGVDIISADEETARQARLLNQAFRKHARTGRPWVLFKSAMTLDGKVATRTGDSQWISGVQSRELAHHWRASVDAVAIGIGTALTDDPQLTARVEGVHHQPRRVVFDSLARLPVSSRLVQATADVPLIVVASRAAPRTETDALIAAGADVIVVSGENEPGSMGIAAILLEGGPHLAGAFLDAGEIDEVRLFLAPMLLGGANARDPLEGGGVARISEAIAALTLDCEHVGDDLLISARLREW